MFHFIRSTLAPQAYHGKGKKPPFFEGWYYKLVDSTTQHRIAVIPGLFLGETPESTQAFVQFFEGQRGEVTLFTFPLKAFQDTPYQLDFTIGDNRFTDSSIHLNLKSQRLQVSGSLTFKGVTPWPITLRSPGIMGWYAWAPFMQCYHGVVSLDHALVGKLQINEREIDFTGGRGYIEKDWGRAFPSAWIWVQSNHFSTVGTSLTASVAIIPWIRGAFPGFIIGLWHQNHLYRFATYTGAKITRLELREKEVLWIVQDKTHRLEMQARGSDKAGLLHAPTPQGMTRRIAETLDGEVQVRLFSNGKLVLEDLGNHAGMEMVGNLEELIRMWESEG
ncbi:MAG: hypothetical protein D6748_09670 [Calditrichaeota bacterium]|nr:MAG: hypothetical protein D6748_09670 [Calditrichota bacterium]